MGLKNTGLSPEERPSAAKARKRVNHVSHPSDLDALMNTARVRAFFGNVSAMTIWRWRKDPELGFPMPVIIRHMPFWVRGEILTFRDKHRRPAVLTEPDRGVS